MSSTSVSILLTKNSIELIRDAKENLIIKWNLIGLLTVRLYGDFLLGVQNIPNGDFVV